MAAKVGRVSQMCTPLCFHLREAYRYKEAAAPTPAASIAAAYWLFDVQGGSLQREADPAAN